MSSASPTDWLDLRFSTFPLWAEPLAIPPEHHRCFRAEDGRIFEPLRRHDAIGRERRQLTFPFRSAMDYRLREFQGSATAMAMKLLHEVAGVGEVQFDRHDFDIHALAQETQAPN